MAGYELRIKPSAVKELEKAVGTRFHATVHEALKSVIAHRMERQQATATVDHG